MDALRPQSPQANGLQQLLTWLQTPRRPSPPPNPYNYSGSLEDLAKLPEARSGGTADAMPQIDPNVPMEQSLGSFGLMPSLNELGRGRL